MSHFVFVLFFLIFNYSTFFVTLSSSTSISIFQSRIHDYLLQIKGFDSLDELAKKEFIRICFLNKEFFFDIFLTSEDVLKFLRCNSFCKNFFFRDISFEEYKKALNVMFAMKIYDEKSLHSFLIWHSFYLFKYSVELSEVHYQKALLFSKKCSIYSQNDFLNWIEWNGFSNHLFFRDLSVDEFHSVKAFYDFFKTKDPTVSEEDLSQLCYIFFFTGSDKIWKILSILGAKNFDDFKKILFVLVRWQGNIQNNWINQSTLVHLLIADSIYFDNGKRLSYSDFESIHKSLSLCPDLTVQKIFQSKFPHSLVAFKNKKTDIISSLSSETAVISKSSSSQDDTFLLPKNDTLITTNTKEIKISANMVNKEVVIFSTQDQSKVVPNNTIKQVQPTVEKQIVNSSKSSKVSSNKNLQSQTTVLSGTVSQDIIDRLKNSPTILYMEGTKKSVDNISSSKTQESFIRSIKIQANVNHPIELSATSKEDQITNLPLQEVSNNHLIQKLFLLIGMALFFIV